MSTLPRKKSCLPGFSPGPNFLYVTEAQNWTPAFAGATVFYWSVPQ